MVGVHASFTCSDETLSAAAELAREHNTGVHIHVAESADDSNAGIRLRDLATDKWLLVHAVHLQEELPGTIAHNPRSNMNNSVGYARPTQRTNTVILGTDGIGADMLEEARLAYVALRNHDVQETPDTVWSWLRNGEAFFPEVRTDTVTWSYDHADSPWHVAFMPGIRCTDVTMNGRTVVQNGVPTEFDMTEIRTKAAEAAHTLHKKLSTQ
jgi:hypothetical protein